MMRTVMIMMKMTIIMRRMTSTGTRSLHGFGERTRHLAAAHVTTGASGTGSSTADHRPLPRVWRRLWRLETQVRLTNMACHTPIVVVVLFASDALKHKWDWLTWPAIHLSLFLLLLFDSPQMPWNTSEADWQGLPYTYRCCCFWCFFLFFIRLWRLETQVRLTNMACHTSTVFF